MASWLDGLSTALTAGTQGAASWLEGQQRGRKEADDRAKELAAALRQKRIDEQNELMQNAQIGKLNKPEAPPEVSRGAAIFQNGKWVIPSPIVPESADAIETKPFMGGTARFKNGNFDTWVIRPQAERDLSPSQVLAQGQRQNSNAMRMEQNYGNEENIKRGKEYASAFQGIKAAEKDSNPQTNLAMMYEAVKMRDPNAVREGELGLQLRARGVPQWVEGMWARAAKGNMLTDTERRQIVNWAKEKVTEQRKLVTPIQARYGAQLRGMGQAADSAFVAPDPFAGVDTGDRASKYRRP
jgi:hypothetical protein